MKLNFRSLIIVAFILMGSFGFAQTVTNVEELNRLAKQFNEENEAALERVKQYTSEHNVPVSFTSLEGRYLEMVDVVDGKPVYNITDS